MAMLTFFLFIGLQKDVLKAFHSFIGPVNGRLYIMYVELNGFCAHFLSDIFYIYRKSDIAIFGQRCFVSVQLGYLELCIAQYLPKSK